ncbi:hypothetical protein [Flavobacterium johnsoniae]|uniref:Uncharacterized protein n=1 Tax=Flavobacterium johnsoniae TaxID=986 RepID=A0A1J7BZB6_FLAJO|nr:hypothetical protein [Flavobacterium johnsoniae]OIV43955.1 hypothetical protein BKM63_01780 [Flavobacterium johnsoniae]
MKKTVTVNEAISKGKITLVYLPMAVMVVIITLGITLSVYDLVPGWTIPITFILGTLLGWITWSYFVNKWKVWAYENVRNVNELKRKAINQKLIWKSDSWFEKTEFKNSEQEAKLQLLQKKFLEKDVYKDDINVPKETLIYYSKTSIYFALAVSVGIILIGIYLVLEAEYWSLILILIGLYLAYDQFTKLKNNNPQIVINDKGIKLRDEKLVSWKNIHDDNVFNQSSGRDSANFLSFNNVMVEIDELDIKFEELEHLLHVYRVRFENNN